MSKVYHYKGYSTLCVIYIANLRPTEIEYSVLGLLGKPRNGTRVRLLWPPRAIFSVHGRIDFNTDELAYFRLPFNTGIIGWRICPSYSILSMSSCQYEGQQPSLELRARP